MAAAIRVEGLGKRYRLTQGSPRGGYRTLRESLVDVATAPFRRLRGGATRATTDDFWALNDVSFEVQPGEVVGIIGRNGAGKSTLLKILSRITKPTKGRVEINGRVGSLLEVGTGFHPELTGRENVYLNGSILGMSRREIDKKFDEIVAFAEVEKFLDTPVKRYSSGMYVRLAFAVAAYLEPEILIVDEVLAVGDAGFQRKCMQRMGEVGREGRTILFVSHNMAAVERLCTRAVFLDQGKVEGDDEVQPIIREYNRRALDSAGGTRPTDSEWMGVIRGLALLDEQGGAANYIPLGGTLRLKLAVAPKEELVFPLMGLGFDDLAGQRLLTVYSPLAGEVIERVTGHSEVMCSIANFPLAPGDYWIKVAISCGGREIESKDRALYLRVVDGDAFGEGRGYTRGICVAASVWHLKRDHTLTLKD